MRRSAYQELVRVVSVPSYSLNLAAQCPDFSVFFWITKVVERHRLVERASEQERGLNRMELNGRHFVRMVSYLDSRLHFGKVPQANRLVRRRAGQEVAGQAVPLDVQYGFFVSNNLFLLLGFELLEKTPKLLNKIFKQVTVGTEVANTYSHPYPNTYSRPYPNTYLSAQWYC